jgi:hypothetical protein
MCSTAGSSRAPVFDCTIGLEDVPYGYHAIASREALKVLSRS